MSPEEFDEVSRIVGPVEFDSMVSVHPPGWGLPGQGGPLAPADLERLQGVRRSLAERGRDTSRQLCLNKPWRPRVSTLVAAPPKTRGISEA